MRRDGDRESFQGGQGHTPGLKSHWVAGRMGQSQATLEPTSHTGTEGGHSEQWMVQK